MLCDDGVMRFFTGPSTRDVLDAVPLSPTQIKQYLDLGPWTQEQEDRFRGVDGRKVVDHQALFHPPDALRPEKMTEDEVRIQSEKVKENNRKVVERWEREKSEGVDINYGGSCARVISDHNLDPKSST